MDPREKKAPNPRMSVPQFGGWDTNAPEATNYSVVFTQARQNKKHQKTDLSEVRRKSIGKEEELMDDTHQNSRHHHHHGHVPAQVHPQEDTVRNNRHHHHLGHGHVPAQVHPQEDSVVVGKRRMLTYINCCIRP